MLWFLLVIASSALQALGNLIDRVGVSSVYKNLFAYAFLAGLANFILSIALLIVFPFQGTAQDFATAIAISLLYGVLNACWYLGLSQGEATRLIPFAGIFPLFTLFWAMLLIGETLLPLQIAGIVIAVTGSLLITMKDFRSLRFEKGAKWMLANAILWGLFHVVQKPILQKLSPVNLWGVMGIGFFAVLSLSLYSKATREELKRIMKKPKAFALPMANEALYLIAMIAVTAALVTTSASLVATAENLKLAFVFILALIAGRFFPKYFKEELDGRALAMKIGATALIAAGVYLAAF